MSFTIKNLVGTMPDKHRMYLGGHIAKRYRELFTEPLQRIEEDGFQVCCYPDEYRAEAERILAQYKENYLKPEPPKEPKYEKVEIKAVEPKPEAKKKPKAVVKPVATPPVRFSFAELTRQYKLHRK
jgi:hypothetical protein